MHAFKFPGMFVGVSVGRGGYVMVAAGVEETTMLGIGVKSGVGIIVGTVTKGFLSFGIVGEP